MALCQTGQTRLEIANSILATLARPAPPSGLRLHQRSPAREQAPENIAVLKALARRRRTPRQPHLLPPSAQRPYDQPSSKPTSPKNEPLSDHSDGRSGLALVPLSLPPGGRHPRKASCSPRLAPAERLSDRPGLARLRRLPLERPYARCVDKHDDKAIDFLRLSYLSTADQYITVFREVTHTLYGRDIPYVLLLHIGAFDAKMLPDLIDLLPSPRLHLHNRSPKR